MQRHFRKSVWLAIASLVILSLTIGSALAHEGRPAGDYRFIVGWLEEPAYEGARNAVSVKVNKVVESAPHTMEGQSEGSGHGPSDHHDDAIESGSAMSVVVEASVDPVSGINVQIIPAGFTFSPESVNQEHVDGEGHAHVYVDGVKLSRVYTPWLHLDGLDPGMREVKISLNANSHEAYAWGGAAVEAVTHVTVPEPGHGMTHHGAETIEAEGPISVDFRLEADPLGGANLFITETSGFAFAPQNASGEHAPGEGHAHVYVNGVKVSRLYGGAFQLGKLAEGMNEVRVTLNANSHEQYTWDGHPVEATNSIHIEPGTGGEGYGEPSGHGEDGHSHGEGGNSSLMPDAPKVLASVAGQHAETEPVEGLEGSIQVEVIHVASGASRTLDLIAVFGEPGHYVAHLIPTASGVYEFRVFGSIEGLAIDETFASMGGGGGFDDIRPSAGLQFPEELPELREIESGVRGALTTAQQAQDAALAAQEDGGSALAIVALIVGIVGVVFGIGGIFFGLRARQT